MKIKVTLTKSPIGYSQAQHKVLQALGLGKVGSSAIHEDSPGILGMVRKCMHLVTVETLAQ
ncbi:MULTISPECIES: 50S ribosomal protein L30 [Desulfosporosinus]|uniref:Large ribosomal subunit protein uL30 n=2 Tax=Desulfosporosinus TaxID=79206 RepID=A0A1G8DMM0_9FIRM|nr:MULTISPECIES: 50S ribosomal protein L30 [Desulfosporosinus]AFQ42326.1 LSU ribosomal protein L30P [Desulfosporosinus meridiei DSM 13257]KGK90998.1 50S ribosomal protein L30 [Desulfosporosinus sp. HMP52]SDH58825.1 large subunit ribosomal protein L30 [Desulfosporosinus hippei DSM 8344]